jgi:hypothetical protein
MDDINGIRLKDIYNIVPKQLAKVLEGEGIYTIGELESLDLEEFNKYQEANEILKNYLDQLRHKIATRPDEIRAAKGAEEVDLPDDEQDDLNFMKSFTRVLNEYHNLQSMGAPSKSTVLDWKSLKTKEEGMYIEFKSSLLWDYHQQKTNKDLEQVCAKTISAFLNRNGGRLIIGVSDDGEVLGLEKDLSSFGKKRSATDQFKLRVTNIIESYLGSWVLGLVRIKLLSVGEKQICMVRVQPASEPCYLKMPDGTEKFYIRSSAKSTPLKPSGIQKYIQDHWKK